MHTIIYKASERGTADYGWLKPNYYFSFSNYHNPSKVHFGALRVLNDDFIIKGINEQIEVEIRDKDMLKSDLIGGVSLSVDNLVQNGGLTDQWYDITYKGKFLGKIKNGGRIKISSSFVDFSK